MSYLEFLDSKMHHNCGDGFDPVFVPDSMFDFQKYLFEWGCRRSRGAIFADCGLGKTIMQLAWAENVVRKTNGRVLILSPLAVGSQTVREGEKFGIDCEQSRNGRFTKKIVIANYQQLHRFISADFIGLVCDESSILKNFQGHYRKAITEFMRDLRYRLLCTATAAPNDFPELGTSAEALGEMGYMDMLSMFFKNDRNTCESGRMYGQRATEWRFKGHAEIPFWRWVSSWARAGRKPSDLGFADGGFVLPPVTEIQHVVENTRPLQGQMFVVDAKNVFEEREELKQTLTERCEKVAEIADTGKPVVCWCHLNPEGDLLEKIVIGAKQVHGRQSDEEKEELLTAFQQGQVRALVTKSKIAGFGLNWQHCSHMTFFPSHSFEQYYQSIRRCWRFGQKNEVKVDIVTTPAMSRVLANLQRKARDAERIFDEIVKYMGESLKIETKREFIKKMEVPSWMSSIR